MVYDHNKSDDESSKEYDFNKEKNKFKKDLEIGYGDDNKRNKDTPLSNKLFNSTISSKPPVSNSRFKKNLELYENESDDSLGRSYSRFSKKQANQTYEGKIDFFEKLFR